MTRAACLALAALMLSSCKIERTPQEYIDQRAPAVQARESASEDFEERMAHLRVALDRGQPDALITSLNLSPDVYLVADPGAREVRGEAAVRAAIEEFLSASPNVRLRDVQHSVSPRAFTAWFNADLEFAEGASEPALRVTGVFVRDEAGDWQLVQAHVSEVGPRAR